jgi:hypothetical protein
VLIVVLTRVRTGPYDTRLQNCGQCVTR